MTRKPPLEVMECHFPAAGTRMVFASSPGIPHQGCTQTVRGIPRGAYRFAVDRPCLSRDDYFDLGCARSIFLDDDRAEAYALFEKYLAHLRSNGCYDMNLLSHEYGPAVRPQYDFVVVDEVQDITNVQLRLILRHLHRRASSSSRATQTRSCTQFLLVGAREDALPSGTGGGAPKKIIRILHTNYRNFPQVTEIGKQVAQDQERRFGSIDRESNYLVTSSLKTREVKLVAADPASWAS